MISHDGYFIAHTAAAALLSVEVHWEYRVSQFLHVYLYMYVQCILAWDPGAKNHTVLQFDVPCKP